MIADQITHCMTIGRRPDLLRQTLSTLETLPQIPTLAINDFGDPETNAALADVAPWARLVGPGHQLGHHRAVDALYAHVTTPFIFHNEDDWAFHRTDFLPQALDLLQSDPKIACVCLRATQDIPAIDAQRDQISDHVSGGIRYQRLDHLHPQWYGFTFNPHLSRKSLWADLGGYASFEKERHISRHLKAEGYFAAYMLPPACSHIGEGRSAFQKPPGLLKKLKGLLRGH